MLFLAGLVLLLEEDHYVSEDFLSVLHLTEVERSTRYPNIEVICLGTYLEQGYNYIKEHKMVISLLKVLINKIQRHHDHYSDS